MPRIQNVKVRAGTTAEWLAAKVVGRKLDARELGYDVSTTALKVGDGTTDFDLLPAVGSGTYARAYMPEAYGAVGDGTTDDTAAVQACITAAIAAKGEVRLSRKYLITSGLTATGRVTIRGTGSFGGDLVSNASLVTASRTIDLLTINGHGSVLEDFSVVNTAGFGGTIPTAGSGIKFTAGWYSHMTRVGISGFYDNLVHTDSCYYSVTDCKFLDPIRYGVSMSNGANQDYGEVMFHGNVITLWKKTTDSTAAIKWTSGGGLKFLNNKINGGIQPTGPGGSATAGYFTRGFDMQIADGLETADIIITGNSIENCVQANVYVGQQDSGAGTGSVSNVIITSNEMGFFGQARGVWLNGVGTPVGGGVNNVLVANNVLVNIPGVGIYATYIKGLHIGTNRFKNSGTAGVGSGLYSAVWIAAGCTDVSQDPQNFEGDAKTLYFNDEWASTQNEHNNKQLIRLEYEREIPATTSTSTYVVLYRFVAPQFSAGTIKVTIAGNIQGKGAAVWHGTRSWIRDAAAITAAVVGTDTTAGFTFDVLFDTATNSGQLIVKLRLNSVTGGTDICGRVRMEILGPVASVTKGV